jgi:hypothetical protein
MREISKAQQYLDYRSLVAYEDAVVKTAAYYRDRDSRTRAAPAPTTS